MEESKNGERQENKKEKLEIEKAAAQDVWLSVYDFRFNSDGDSGAADGGETERQ